MKKTIWILILIFCILLSLFGVLMLVDSIVNYNRIYDDQYVHASPAGSVFTSIVFTGLSIFGILKAKRKLQVKEIDLSALTYQPFHLHLKYAIDYKDYLKIVFVPLSKNPIRFFPIVIVIALVIGTLNQKYINYPGLIFPVLITVLIPGSMYLSAKKNYNSQQYLQNELEFKIDENKIIINGSSFHAENNWAHIIKAIETKDYFLLYTSNVSAHFLLKRYFPDIESENNFRNFLWLSNIKKKDLHLTHS